MSIPTLLSEGLSNILQYLGGTSYITSALHGCEGIVSDHTLRIYDHLWKLFQDIGAREQTDIMEFAKIMDAIFKPLLNRHGTLEARIMTLAQLYRVLYNIYLLNFLRYYKNTD